MINCDQSSLASPGHAGPSWSLEPEEEQLGSPGQPGLVSPLQYLQ